MSTAEDPRGRSAYRVTSAHFSQHQFKSLRRYQAIEKREADCANLKVQNIVLQCGNQRLQQQVHDWVMWWHSSDADHTDASDDFVFENVDTFGMLSGMAVSADCIRGAVVASGEGGPAIDHSVIDGDSLLNTLLAKTGRVADTILQVKAYCQDAIGEDVEEINEFDGKIGEDDKDETMSSFGSLVVDEFPQRLLRAGNMFRWPFGSEVLVGRILRLGHGRFSDQ